MTVTERARIARRSRGRVIASAVLVAASATTTIHDEQPTVVPAAAASPGPRDDVAVRERLLPRAPTVHRRRPAPPQPARIGTALQIRRLRVTMYCWEGSDTALSKPPAIGIVAVKKATGIVYGTRVRIAGFGAFVVADREPSFGVSDVDVYGGRGAFCEREARRFGIQRLDVQIEEAA